MKMPKTIRNEWNRWGKKIIVCICLLFIVFFLFTHVKNLNEFYSVIYVHG